MQTSFSSEILLQVWAKTSECGAAPVFHPLLYHSLDVAAVARMSLAHSTSLLRFADQLHISPHDLSRLLTFWCALHDIGKCSVHFQMRVPALWPGRAAPSFGPLPTVRLAERPHGEITDLYLRPQNDGEGGMDDSTLTALFRQAFGKLGRHEAKVISAIAGHHGVPMSAEGARWMAGPEAAANRPFETAAQGIATQLWRTLQMGDGVGASPMSAAMVSLLSWKLSALLPVCDWVASNQAWFPACAPEQEASDYWARVALPQAERAFASAGLHRAAIAPPEPARTLRHLPGAALTPVQRHAFNVPLGKEPPSLFLIEDATGAGKTEAALTLAHRLMAERGATGFYFALPSMATANAMYGRLAGSYRALFSDDAVPSLALAHGKAGRNNAYLASLSAQDRRNGGDEADNGAYCSGWIADSRRKALLAQAGAGTIDQALMAVLPLRYQSLRLHGLVGKVLILDELHSFDPFMLKLIETLLEFHAMLGGSAVLMSATLRVLTRQRLINAFAQGCAHAPRVAQEGERRTPMARATAYPLVTAFCDGELTETALPLKAEATRRVAVGRVNTLAEAEALALRMAQSGAAVALMRSTVDAAIASFERLRAAHPATQLFHARFLLDDRLSIEQQVLARFGKTGGAAERRGQILVATQVIEQSLDIDFDVIITDLAPVDLLIQRAGRLWRHAREQRPVEAPVLHVISPEPTDHCRVDWLDADMQEAKWIYGDVARLWLTARRLFDAGAIVTATLAEEDTNPAHVRRLVEAVYTAGPDALPTPALGQALDRFAGESYAASNIADQMVLDLRAGYLRTMPWQAEARAVTRLELKPRRTVRLARRDGAVLRPFGEDWSLSEVRVSPTLAKGLTGPTPMEAAALRPAWAEVDDGVCLLVLDTGEQGAMSADGVFGYDAVRGLCRRALGDEDGG